MTRRDANDHPDELPSGPIPPDFIHTIRTAAQRAKVCPDIIRDWIREGLRACPVGRQGKNGSKHYRIKDAWLMEFMDRRSLVISAPIPIAPGLPSKKRQIHPRAKDTSDWARQFDEAARGTPKKS